MKRKLISLVIVAAMILSMFAMAIPAFAATNNAALTIPNITTGFNRTLGTIRLSETSPGVVGSAVQDIFITLPGGIRFQAPPAPGNELWYINIPAMVGTTVNSLAPADVVIVSGTTATLNLKVLGQSGGGGTAFIELRFNVPASSTVNVTASAGDVEVDILETSGAVTSGKVVNARVISAGTTSQAMAKPAVSKAAGQGFGAVRVIENSPGALEATKTLTVVLPDYFTWAGAPAVNVAGGFGLGDVTFTAVDTDVNGRSRATFTVNAASVGSAGVIDISGWSANVSEMAPLGDVTVSIGGTAGASAASLAVARVTEFGVEASAKSVPEIFAGRWTATNGVLVLEESAWGSLLQNRTVKLTLPEGSVWRTFPTANTVDGNVVIGAGVVSNNNRTLTYTVTAQSTSASKVEFRDGRIDLKANFPAGDLNVVIEGNAGASGTVAIAAIVAPITATVSETTNVGVGLMAQMIGDITITEVKAGAIVANPGGGAAPGQIIVRTPFDGMTWEGTPTVTVTEGNLRINQAGIVIAAGGRNLVIPITTSSTTASTIEITNAKVTLDRTVPKGAQTFGVRGSALDWAGNVAANLVDASSAATVVAATTVTPAPDEATVTAKPSVFTIGQESYMVDGAAVAMDVAPYIKDGRTFLPVRYVAAALGVTPGNILWDAATMTATIFKGDRIAQVTIGSRALVVNGVTVMMDVAAEVVDGRTMLPVRWVGQALGADVDWDATAQTVTVTP